LGAGYYPEYARRAKNGDMSVMDIVPRPDHKNTDTWGTDFNKKRNTYYKLLKEKNQSQGDRVEQTPRYGMTDPEPENFTPVVKSKDVNYKNLDPRLKTWYDTHREQYGDIMITSANDFSGHVKGSKHYNNKAIDIRTQDTYGKRLRTDVMNKGQFVYNTSRGPVYAFNGVKVLIESNHLHISI
jgi:hypothetical protein